MGAKNKLNAGYINGALVPRDEAKISVFDSAVMLGDTVTESTRTFAHKPFKLEQHIARLYKSLKVTRINPGLTADEMLELSLQVLEANRRLLDPDEDCWLVHNISRGLSVAGADPTVQRSPHGRCISHCGPRVYQTLCADPVSVHPKVPHEPPAVSLHPSSCQG